MFKLAYCYSKDIEDIMTEYITEMFLHEISNYFINKETFEKIPILTKEIYIGAATAEEIIAVDKEKLKNILLTEPFSYIEKGKSIPYLLEETIIHLAKSLKCKEMITPSTLEEWMLFKILMHSETKSFGHTTKPALLNALFSYFDYVLKTENDDKGILMHKETRKREVDKKIKEISVYLSSPSLLYENMSSFIMWDNNWTMLFEDEDIT